MWLFGVIQIPLCMAASLYLSDYILVKYQSLLKGGGPYFLWIMCAFYLIRFFISCCQKNCMKKKKRDDDSKRECLDEPNEDTVDESTQIIPKEVISIDPIDNPSSDEPNQSVNEEDKKGMTDIDVMLADEGYENIPLENDEEKKSEEVEKVEGKCGICIKALASKGQKLLKDFNYSKRFEFWALRGCLLTIASLIISFVAGVVKISGGTAYMVLLRFIYGMEMIVSTGSAMFISFFLVCGLLGGIVHHTDIFDMELLMWCGISTICSAIGCIIGSSFMTILDEYWTFLLIALSFGVLGLISLIVAQIG